MNRESYRVFGGFVCDAVVLVFIACRWHSLWRLGAGVAPYLLFVSATLMGVLFLRWHPRCACASRMPSAS
jgi:hypothetical protein